MNCEHTKVFMSSGAVKGVYRETVAHEKTRVNTVEKKKKLKKSNKK